MDKELENIVANMVAAGESEENIALVIQNYEPSTSKKKEATESPSPSSGGTSASDGSGFDPEGDGYDYETAEKYGLGPDESGHWPSRVPETGQLLKGRGHETYSKTVEGEANAGNHIYQKEDGRYYSNAPSISQVPEQIVDNSVLPLYAEYKQASKVTPEQAQAIDETISDQEAGKRSFWETAVAVTEGYLKTGFAVPLFQYNDKKELLEQRKQKNKIDFLGSLPKEKVQELRTYAGQEISNLDKQNLNLVAQNKLFEEQGKSLVNQLKYHKDAIETLNAQGKPIPQEAAAEYRALYEEFTTISNEFNKNVDIIENNREDLGDFYGELALLKKNYGGLDYYKDMSRLVAADMMAGVGEFALHSNKVMEEATGFKPMFERPFTEQDVETFRKEVARQREGLAPQMSVSDIEDAKGFGRWLMEQVATQTPVIATIGMTGMAGAANAGLGLLGVSAAGQEIGKLKDEREVARNTIFEAQEALSDPDLPQDIRLEIESELSKAERTADISDSEALLAGAAFGGFEVLTERVTLGILSKGKRVMSSLSKAGREEAKVGMKEFVKDFVQASGRSITAGSKESAAEFLNQIGQNAVEMFYLEDPDVHIFDGAVDALASGAAMGIGMSAAPSMIGIGTKAFMSKETTADIKAKAREASELVKELEVNAETLDPSTKKMLKEKAAKKSKEIKSELQKTYTKVSTMEKSDIKSLIDLDKKANNLAVRVKHLRESDIAPDMKQTFLEELKGEADRITVKKNEILDRYGSKPKKKPGKKKADEGGEGRTEVQGQDGVQRSNDTNVTRPADQVEYTNAKGNAAYLDKGRLKASKDVNPDGFGDQILIKHGNTKVGYIVYKANPETGTANIHLSEIYNESMKGKGIGYEMYKKAGDALAQDGLRMVSDTQRSPASEALWAKLEREGFAKVIGKKKGPSKQKYVHEYKYTYEFVPSGTAAESFSKIDLSDKSGLNKAQDYLRKLQQKLNKQGGETLGMNLPVAVAQGAVAAMQAAVKAAKTGADVLSAGLNYIRSTDWYKGLTKTDQKKAEQTFVDTFDVPGTVYNKEQLKRSRTEIDDLRTIVGKLLSGLPIITYLEEQTFTRVARATENFITKKIKQALKSSNTLARQAAQIATSFFNGLPRTDVELAESRRVTGNQEAAYLKGLEITKKLQAIIGNDIEMARRVHAAMDPEIYGDDALEFNDLNDAEKELFRALREINDGTHNLNYALGFIGKDVYEKYKGNYIGRGYEPYEDMEAVEKADFISNKIFDKIYAKRAPVDEWKIDNKIQDPIYLTVNRMIQTQRNVAVANYANFIARDRSNISDGPKEGFTLLSGKAYGALNGKYVVNYIAEDFKGYFFANKLAQYLYEAAKTYDTIKYRQVLKKYHTVWSPVVQIGNFMSNHAFAMTAGVNLVQLWGHLPAARKGIIEQDADYMKLVENNIIGANILKGELSVSKTKEETLRMEETVAEEGFQVLERGADALNRLDEWAQERYSRSDDIMKLAAYKSLRDAGYNQEDAVQRVFEGFQNYATVGKIWDAASKTPIFGNPYVKFQADLMRIVKNSVTKRPLTTSVFLGALKVGAYAMSSYLAGESDEAREEREARPFIPKISTGIMDIPLVWKVSGEEGIFDSGVFKDKEINLARFISPYYEYDLPGESFGEKITNMAPYQWRQFEAKEMGQTTGAIDTPDVLLGSIVAAFVYNRDFRNKSISDPDANRYTESGLSDEEKFMNRMHYILRSTLPLYSTAQDVVLSKMYGEDYYGRDKSLLDIIISKAVKVQTYDKESLRKTVMSKYKTINYQAKSINEKIKSIRRKAISDMAEYNKRVEEGRISTEKRDANIERIKRESLRRQNEQMEKLVKLQEELNELVENTAAIRQQYGN